jgi:hypothetical protein
MHHSAASRASKLGKQGTSCRWRAPRTVDKRTPLTLAFLQSLICCVDYPHRQGAGNLLVLKRSLHSDACAGYSAVEAREKGNKIVRTLTAGRKGGF